MSAVVELENLGLEVRLDGIGGLSLGGLRRLAPDGRQRALELALQHKRQIVSELELRAFPAGEAGRVAGGAREPRQDAPQGAVRSQDNVNIAPGAFVRSGASCAAGQAYPVGEVAGARDFRGEAFFPSEYNDWCFRLMVAEGVIQ
jgi:hypothetical protein